MSRTLTASDRSALIRLASTLPAGSAERRAILAGLSKVSFKEGQSVRVDMSHKALSSTAYNDLDPVGGDAVVATKDEIRSLGAKKQRGRVWVKAKGGKALFSVPREALR